MRNDIAMRNGSPSPRHRHRHRHLHIRNAGQTLLGLGAGSLATVLFAVSLLWPQQPAVAADDTAQLALGKKLFTQGTVPSCAVCHTLEAAGAEGAVGPVLDELKPDAARVAKALRDGLGQMPSYKGKLSEDEIAALARFVSKASGGAK